MSGKYCTFHFFCIFYKENDISFVYDVQVHVYVIFHHILSVSKISVDFNTCILMNELYVLEGPYNKYKTRKSINEILLKKL